MRTNKDLYPLSEIVNRAQAKGVDFGNSNPENRIRYYIKFGLLPHAKRKSFNGEAPTAAFQIEVVDLIIDIEKKRAKGKSIAEQKLLLENQPKPKRKHVKNTPRTTYVIPEPRSNFVPRIALGLTLLILILFLGSLFFNLTQTKESDQNVLGAQTQSDNAFVRVLKTILRPIAQADLGLLRIIKTGNSVDPLAITNVQDFLKVQNNQVTFSDKVNTDSITTKSINGYQINNKENSIVTLNSEGNLEIPGEIKTQIDWSLIKDKPNLVDQDNLLAGSNIKISQNSLTGAFTISSTATSTTSSSSGGNGTITAVAAGNGLSGGGTNGSVSLAIDTAIVASLNDTQAFTNKTLGISNSIAGDAIKTGNLGAAGLILAFNSFGSITGILTDANISNSLTLDNTSNIDAAALTSGTVNNSRLTTNVTLQGNTFNGASQLVQLNGSIQLPAISGILLTNLNASNLSSGTVADTRLSTNVTVQGNSFNGVTQLVQTNASGQLPALSGVNLTNLNAGNLASGTVNDARLSANVALLNATQIFTGNNTFNNITINPTSSVVGLTLTGTTPVSSGAGTNATNMIFLTSANGGDATNATSTGGTGSGFTFVLGNGGASSGNTSATGGLGGSFSLSAGVGGNATGIGGIQGGSGGSISLTGGGGFAPVGGSAGNGGSITLTGGAGGVGVNGAGGSVNIFSGAGSNNANAAPGAINIDTGVDPNSGNAAAINIGTTNANTIHIGNATGISAISFTSGTFPQTFTSSNATGQNTSSSFVYVTNSLTTGTGFNFQTSSTTTGTLFLVRDTSSVHTSGKIGIVREQATYTTAVVNSAQILNIDRNLTINAAATTLTVNGPAAQIISNCTVISGTCLDSGSLLDLTQSYASATGPLLKGTQNGAGDLIDLLDGATTDFAIAKGGFITTNPTSALTSGQTGFNVNGTSNLSSIFQVANVFQVNGTTGASASGQLKAININITDSSSSSQFVFGLSTNFGGTNANAAYYPVQGSAGGATGTLGLISKGSVSTNCGDIALTGGASVGVCGIASSSSSYYGGILSGTGGGVGLRAVTDTGTALQANITGASGTIVNFMNAGTTVFGIAKSGQVNMNVAFAGPACASLVNGDFGFDSTNNRIFWKGTGGTCSYWNRTGTFDIAEHTPATESTEPGDVLVIDTVSTSFAVKKSTTQYQQTVLGIESTDPTLISNPDALGPANFVSKMALAGRVPTKVSTENGPIQPGDYLTTSSTPGVAMKATSTGPTLGKALEAYSSLGVGKILVFVNISYYLNPADFKAYTIQNNSSLIVKLGNAAKYIWQNSSGQVVASVNNLGEAIFSKVTTAIANVDKLIFGEIAVKKASQSGGIGEISADQNEVVIPSNKVKDDSLINVTTTSEPDGVLFVKSKTAGVGFVVGIKRFPGNIISQKVNFNWLIINQE